MLLNVTLLWLLLKVMRMWMFRWVRSLNSFPLCEKKKKIFFFFSFWPTCVGYASGLNICYYSILKQLKNLNINFIMDLGAL